MERPTLPTLLLPLLLLALATTASAARCHPDDKAGLLALKSAVTADPTGLLSSWKPGTDCCTWNGVSCRVASRVTELSISGKEDDPASYLSGTIPPGIARLSKLVGIYFEDLKNLTGPLPPALFRLPDLTYVYIRNASLSGAIPDLAPLAPKLYALSLTGNSLSGPIPASVGQLTQLTTIDLSRNRLSGVIPPAVGRLSNLSQLSLHHNDLSGAIPDLSALTGLYFLQLSHNQFVGGIPPSLAPMAPRLRFLELGHNKLTGGIPAFLGRFTQLDTLDLSGNLLTGTVPATFRNLTKIFNLDLSGNALVDPFPAMAVKGIESLDLSHNRFHLGKIPGWVSTSPILYSLKLAGCGIRMRMEDFKPTETYFLEHIDLSGNEITGSPVALLNRTEYLVSFRAAGNKLAFDMARLPLPKTLQDLDLSRNAVYGKVPAAVAGLKTLDVSYNRLCGPLPKTGFPSAAFAGNACLCGGPLAPCHRRS